MVKDGTAAFYGAAAVQWSGIVCRLLVGWFFRLLGHAPVRVIMPMFAR